MSAEGHAALRALWTKLELGRSPLLSQKTKDLPTEEVLGKDFVLPEASPRRKPRSSIFDEPDMGGVSTTKAGGY